MVFRHSRSTIAFSSRFTGHFALNSHRKGPFAPRKPIFANTRPTSPSPRSPAGALTHRDLTPAGSQPARPPSSLLELAQAGRRLFAKGGAAFDEELDRRLVNYMGARCA